MSRFLIAGLIVSALGVSAVQAASYSEPPTKDTYARNGDEAVRARNYGVSPTFAVGSAGGFTDNHVEFAAWQDLPVDLIGSTVNSGATLTYKLRYASYYDSPGPPAGPWDYAVQVLTTDWAEGTGLGVDFGDGLNYHTYNGVDAWPGGSPMADNDVVRDINDDIVNFTTTSLGHVPYANEQLAGTIVFDMTSALQYWADGNPNYGIRIIQLGEPLSGAENDSVVVGWSSDEPVYEPILDFTYEVGSILDGDLNTDGFVGQDDLNLVLAKWGQTVSANDPADPNGDLFIGQDDLNPVLADWGQGTPLGGLSAVPEPSTGLLAALAGLVILRLRKKRR